MPTSPSDKQYEKHIFRALNLSESDRKYIHVKEGAICFTFSLKLKLELWVGDKKLSLDKEARNGISESITDFFRRELSNGEFTDVLIYSTDPSEREEMEFFRDIGTDKEAIEAIRWLIKFKKRFGF